jgi:SAM-dependent methyltransferase
MTSVSSRTSTRGLREHNGFAGEHSAELTYEAFAPFYDDFTAHHDYEHWLGNLLAALECCGLRGDRLLDVGCGTGKSFIPMLERGWRVTACDVSAAMVMRARAKVGDAVRFEVADMRALPAYGEFDLVWSLDDAVNYLLGADELERALAGMAANLAPDGLLLFDLNTLRSYRSFFAEIDERMLADGRRIVWRGLTSPHAEPGSICEATFSITDGDRSDPGPGVPVHRQRHFPPAEVEAALSAADLELLDTHGHGPDAVLEQPVDEDRHTKMIFIAGHAKRTDERRKDEDGEARPRRDAARGDDEGLIGP